MYDPTLRADELALIRAVLCDRAPELARLVDRLGVEPLSRPIRDDIRSKLMDEFCAYGIRPDDEPNIYGYHIDSLIDKLRYA